jgi:hypothetical protein
MMPHGHRLVRQASPPHRSLPPRALRVLSAIPLDKVHLDPIPR